MLGFAIHRVQFITVLMLLLFGGALVNCTWVKTTPEAERVRIVPRDRVADCKQLGDVSTYTKSKIAGVNRKADKVKEELETLAQVEAAEMGADTIVVASEVSNGRQTYIVYKCQ